MIQSKEEFARIWKKDSKSLLQLDLFIFHLINELSRQLQTEYFSKQSQDDSYYLNPDQVSELTVQMGDALHFFYEQMCFGKGCSLGCPNKMDKPFSKRENDILFEIIEREFDGNAKACASREDCLRHDLMNYVVKDTLLDFYTYFMEQECGEEDTQLKEMADFVVKILMHFTMTRGSEFLKEPYKETV